MTPELKSIAVFRLSALGDVLMYVPTIRALQQAFPKTKLTWIISKPAHDLVKNLEDVEFLVIDKPKTPWDYLKLRNIFKNYHFDVLFASQACYRTNFMYYFISAKQKIGYDAIRGRDLHVFFVNNYLPFKKVHNLEGYLQFAESLGADISNVRWELPLDKDATEWVLKFLSSIDRTSGPLVLINPAASKTDRTWLVERYIEVIKFLKNKYHANVILCGGPMEFDRQLANQILSEVDAIDLVGKTKLMQLISLIKEADLVICPDTGPSHMAVAVNTPVIALHAVTNPELSGPYGQLHHVVNRYPEAKKQFGKKIKNSLDIRRSWNQKVRHPKVMHLIEVNDVIEKIQMVLN
jgi:heptosyltransferase I